MKNDDSNNEFNMENVLKKNQKIYISLSGCDVNDLKRLTQMNSQFMIQHIGGFRVLKLENEFEDPAIKTAINMLVSRNYIAIEECKDYTDFFENLVSLGIKKLYLVVKNMSQRKDIITAGKKEGIYINFCRLNDDGTIEKWIPKKDEISEIKSKQNRNNKQQENRSGKFQKMGSPYSIKMIPEKINIERIIISNNLDVGDVIYDVSGKDYKLIDKVLVNNGASTYKTNVNGIWVKLYDGGNLNTFIESKINRMIKNPLKYQGICWPLGIAIDGQGNFRGYLMSEAPGEPLHLSVMKKAGLEKNFPDWTKVNLCILVLAILNKIDFLHKNGVLLGCLNPASIRIVDDNTVYFADTDNYQIEGFPSFVYNISFTAPELLGKKIYLTDVDSENFAIAELVFMIMMTGKTPYAVGVNGNPELEIKKMHFPYSNKNIHGNAALPSMWRFMWSHLTPLKAPFYETFQKDGAYNKKGQRRDTKFWIKIIKNFMADLQNPIDEESLKIYPRTFKRGKNEIFYRCSFCGIEHPRFYFSNQFFDEYQICNDCIGKKSNVSFTCVDCGKTYYYTNRTALFHKQKKEKDSEWKDQKHCRDCKRKTVSCKRCGNVFPFYMLRNGLCAECSSQYRSQVYQRIQCRLCGRVFDFTNGDREFYERKGYNFPSKCPECRNGGNIGGYSGGNNNNSNGISRKSFWDRLWGN